MLDHSPTLTIEELHTALDEAMTRERKLIDENRKLRAAVNRWQMMQRQAQSTQHKVAEEMQVYLRDGRLPEVKE